MSKNDWFSVQTAIEGLAMLGCPDVQRYEREPLAQQVTLVGTPDLIAGRPLKGGRSPDDFYIDVVKPSGDHFIREKARAKSGVFVDQLKKAYLDKVDEKIDKYATARKSIMFGMVWAFPEIGEVPDHERKAAQEAALVLAGVVGLDHAPDFEARYRELQSMLAGGDDLLLRVAPLSLDLAFFMWAIKRENNGFGSFLAINARMGSEGCRENPVHRWLLDVADAATKYGVRG